MIKHILWKSLTSERNGLFILWILLFILLMDIYLPCRLQLYLINGYLFYLLCLSLHPIILHFSNSQH